MESSSSSSSSVLDANRIIFDPMYNIEVISESVEEVTQKQLNDMLCPISMTTEQLAYLMEAPIRSFDMTWEDERISFTEDDIALFGGFEENETIPQFVERLFGKQINVNRMPLEGVVVNQEEETKRLRQFKNRDHFRSIVAKRFAENVMFCDAVPEFCQSFSSTRPLPKDIPLPKVPFATTHWKRSSEAYDSQQEAEDIEMTDVDTRSILSIKRLKTSSFGSTPKDGSK